MKKGYKQTEVGVIPAEWEVVKFADIVNIGPQNGLYKSKEHLGHGIHLIDMGDIFGSDIIGQSDFQRRIDVTDEELSKFGLLKGDLLFARRSLVASGSGKCSMVGSFSSPVTFESSIIRTSLNLERAVPELYLAFWNSPRGQRLRNEITRQVASAMAPSYLAAKRDNRTRASTSAVRSAATGERGFLPGNVASMISSGRLMAVGDVEASFGRTDRPGRSTVKRVAYLMAGDKGKDPSWVLQPETHTPVMLKDMLVRVYADMIRRDDSTLTCLGEAERGADPRDTQLKCIKQVIDLQFR